MRHLSIDVRGGTAQRLTGQACGAAICICALSMGGCGRRSVSGYDLEVPVEWVTTVTNPLFPLVPGTTYRYEDRSGSGESVIVEVLEDTRVVNGILATVVRDRVYEAGTLTEDTYDWFAQDVAGNVWYLGEDSREIEAGRVTGTEGSWEWGVDGALPGIIMWADPASAVGRDYRQEYYRGVAEDWGRVVATNQSVTVAAGPFTGCVVTQDWSGLEHGSERKTYCPDVGPVLEQSGAERLELVSVEHVRRP